MEDQHRVVLVLEESVEVPFGFGEVRAEGLRRRDEVPFRESAPIRADEGVAGDENTRVFVDESTGSRRVAGNGDCLELPDLLTVSVLVIGIVFRLEGCLFGNPRFYPVFLDDPVRRVERSLVVPLSVQFSDSRPSTVLKVVCSFMSELGMV